MRYLPLPGGAIRSVVVATLILLAWLAWGSFQYPEALWAPGNLSRFHADSAQCADCHEPFRGVRAEKCIACHRETQFAAHSKPTIYEFHRQSIRKGRDCMDCHTEHHGALAQITVGAMLNPHGEFVFRATDTHSCGACHDFSAAGAKLLDNAAVRHLLDKGEGSHRLGKMAHCLSCHRGGRRELEDEED